jgi:hypothetical protein
MKRKPSLSIILIFVAMTASCARIESHLAGCGNDVVKEVTSPNGKMKAVLFERDCGATTSSTSQISLLSSGRSLPNEIGNLFVAGKDDGRAPGAPWGGPMVEVSWTDDTHLLVKYDNRASISKREESFGNINIRYEALSP